jgi:hypothetical protein
MNATMVRRTRRIDDGEPLVLSDPPPDDNAAAYVVYTAVCDNPECTCTRMWLGIRPAQRIDDDTLEIGKVELEGEVSANGSDVKLYPDTSGVFTPTVTQWLRRRLGEEGPRAWFAERWCRARGQIGDPAYPSGVPPRHIDGMVSFSEVFPYEFDLTVVHERRLYLADDQYCLEPACTCQDVAIYFVDVAAAKGLGHARASVRRLRAPTVDGPPVIPVLWDALLEQQSQARLRERFKRMRAVARTRPRSSRPAARPKVSRNAPCPCGSGRKYKRCCGA